METRAPRGRKSSPQALEAEAIELATAGRWQEALEVNTECIEISPEDSGAYNRLGKALMELGQYHEAQAAFSRTLEILPTNSIAKKNLKRLEHLLESAPSRQGTYTKIAPQHFIEETGKTGITVLIAPGPPEVLAWLDAGVPVALRQDSGNLIAESTDGQYLGQVEPKLAFRLSQLMEGGNRYEGAVTSVDDDKISVIIREVFQDPSQVGKFPFPSKDSDGFRSDIKESLIKYELGQEVTSHDDELDSWEDKEDPNVPDGISIVSGDRDKFTVVEEPEKDETGES